MKGLFFSLVRVATLVKTLPALTRDIARIDQGARKVSDAIKRVGEYESKVLSIQSMLPGGYKHHEISDTIVAMSHEKNIPALWVADMIEGSLYYANDTEMYQRFGERLGKR